MEEQVDRLCARAGELALLGVPVFLFQEGDDSAAQSAFREIARLTKGAYCRFDRGSAKQLRELLTAVAVYAAGGRKALAGLERGAPRRRRAPSARATRPRGTLRRDGISDLWPSSAGWRPFRNESFCARQSRARRAAA